MLLSVAQLSRHFNVRPKGVLHVGAHGAEEADNYRTHGWGPVIWVEMLPDKFEALRSRFAGDPSNMVLHAACWDADGVKLPIFRASNGQSSSLLQPDQHLSAHPRISFTQDTEIATSRLDTILPAGARFDYLSLDIQGAELRALRGLGARLAEVTWACVEVNTQRLYADCALIGEIDAYLGEAGFIRLITRMAGAKGWGDALYVNTRKLDEAEVRRLKAKAAVLGAYQAFVDLPGKLRPKALLRRLQGKA